MKRRNYTREILAQMADGRTPFSSIGSDTVVEYMPRSKGDPKPWTDGTFRYSGRYVHTVAPCYGKVHTPSGRPATCALMDGHQGDCQPST